MSYYKIRPRSGTAAQWTSANPILAEREIGYEYPAGGLGTGRVKMKMGDGSTHWNDLPYATVSPIVENVESTSTENVPSSAYVKNKFDTLNSKLTTKSYTATPAANSVVSPFSTYVEVMIPSADLSAYGTPVAIMTAGGGSANPVVVRMNVSRTGFWVYAKNTTPVDVYVLFMK